MSSLSRLWCHFQKPFSLEVGCFRSYSRLSSNPFPFPIHPNAQPHDIFHLPRSATQKEIKQRYYDLVRVYHPDSIIARRYPPEVTQERIQAINKAYDILRGRAISLEAHISATPGHRMDSAWFKPRSSRRPYFDDVVGDDRWTERTIVLIAVVTLVAFVAQTSFTRLQVLKSWTPRQASSAAAKHAQSDDSLTEASMQDEKS